MTLLLTRTWASRPRSRPRTQICPRGHLKANQGQRQQYCEMVRFSDSEALTLQYPKPVKVYYSIH